MRKPSNYDYIQPDSRGRIQLPKALRKHRLFELKEVTDGLLLIPLSVKSEQRSIWLQNEGMDYFQRQIVPRLSQASESIQEISAIFLYGSRARGDALSTSDFDLGILCKAYPSFQRRNEITDLLQGALENELRTLERHGIHAHLSVQFFSAQIDSRALPPIYFSIFRDHILLFKRDAHWDKLLSDIKSAMKAGGVKDIGEGKYRKWVWKNG